MQGFFASVFKVDRWAYLAHGLFRRFRQPRRCPCCSSPQSHVVDRKFVYTLQRCDNCAILYRFPYETAGEMADFYQEDYAQAGLTTDLPSGEQLGMLLSAHFQGSDKDFSRIPPLFAALGLGAGATILDYGANWGYGTLQLRQAGYSVEAFEISRPRAKYGEKLGVHIHTNLSHAPGPFDIVYSSHVLEHVPNPCDTLRQQLAHTKHGGFVVAHTPNGSEARMLAEFDGFHLNWGMVHPVLLNDLFLEKNFAEHPIYLSTESNGGTLAQWNRQSIHRGNLAGGELLLIIRNHPLAPSPTKATS